jgi:protocatechuate 3,4-dioxygenase beta subunit
VVAQATTAPASPEATCVAPAQPTSAQTEGPFFKAGSPERASLVDAGMPGVRLLLTGRVVTRSCAPVSRALLDFWQADANGEYDTAGYRLRGHLFTDAQGTYRLETLVPGAYTGRTRHIHVKAQAPGRATLTSQIYFPDEQQNATDSIFRPELLARVDSRTATAWAARFDFVLDLP